MRLLAIDPGPEQSAALIYDAETGTPLWWAKDDNESVLDIIETAAVGHMTAMRADLLAVEMIASYGMAVGATTFETCVWIGRFVERWAWESRSDPQPFTYVYRRDVKLHLCGSMRAKDPNVRQALIDRYGGKDRAIGRKATPGVLYGLTGDCWSALAVAVTACETRLGEERAA